jgi:SLOG cluster4 family
VVAVGGEWGTLSEIGLAGTLGRPVVLLKGWRLQHEAALPSELHYAETPQEAVDLAARLAART